MSWLYALRAFLRDVVWTAVFAALLAVASVWAAYSTHSLTVTAGLGLAAIAFATLATRR